MMYDIGADNFVYWMRLNIIAMGSSGLSGELALLIVARFETRLSGV